MGWIRRLLKRPETFDEYCARLEAYISTPEHIEAARKIKPSIVWNRATGEITRLYSGEVTKIRHEIEED